MDFDEKKFKPSSNRTLLHHQVREQSDICDVTIQVGQWTKKYHWCVLVMSPFFECIRRSDFIEKQTGLVKLDIASPLTTEIAISFLYGKKPKLAEDNVGAVLKLSEFLLIPKLKSACVAFIKKNSITEENCMKMLELSSLYEFEFPQCDDYIRGHMQEVLQKEEAKFLTKESVLALLTDPLLSYVLAEDKFKFVIRWANSSQQNKDAFRDVLEVIDLKSMSGEFLQSVVFQHPLVIEMNCNQPDLFSQDTFQDHRVLLFPESNDKKRIACFDLEGERWCGIEIGLPEDSDVENSIKNDSAGGMCGPREVYRVSERYNKYKFCIQNLHSKEYTIKTLSKPENSVSAYAISKETYVAVSNERKEIISKRLARSSFSTSQLMKLRMLNEEYLAPTTRLRLVRSINESHGRHRAYEDTATVYCGQLQNSEISICPLLTIRKTTVDSVCVSANNLVGLYSNRNAELHIYDMYHCTLDTITLSKHFGTSSMYSGIRVATKEAGFVLYNNETVLSVSRSNGPDSTERYTVQTTKLEHDRKWDRNNYIYSNRMWFRLMRKQRKDDIEFSCIRDDVLMKTNVEDVTWTGLPPPPKDTCTREENNAFIMELPKSMLRCHFECPHCFQLKKKQLEQRRISQSRVRTSVADFSFLYDGSDGDYYDDSDYYYSSSD